MIETRRCMTTTAAQLVYQLDHISIRCAYQTQAFLCNSGK